MHKHIAIQDQEGVFAVERDGKILLCPKVSYPQVNATQKTSMSPYEYQTNLLRMACSTNCPFAVITETTVTGDAGTSEKKPAYEISCEGGCKTIILDEVRKFEKPPVVSPLQIAK